MVAKSYIDGFIPEGKDASACVNCGICLQKCQVMKMGKEESKEEIRRLINGEETKRVLDECTFCFSCNHFCPAGLRPYALIMERITARNREKNIPVPAITDYMITGTGKSGYFYDQYEKLPAEDQAILDEWTKVPPKSNDVLFVGCYGRTIPQRIQNSQVLSRLPKFGPRDACCGEMPYRFGKYDAFTDTVDRAVSRLKDLDTQRLVCYCASCHNGFGNIFPNYHGVKLPFKTISLYEWLWEKLQAGELTIKRKVSKNIVLSDSCYTSELGDGYYEAIRGLYKAMGMNVVELPTNRYESMCCGFSCAVRNYDLTQVAVEAKKKLEAIASTQVGEVTVNCPGCWSGITRSAEANGQKLTVRYAMSGILWALGDENIPDSLVI